MKRTLSISVVAVLAGVASLLAASPASAGSAEHYDYDTGGNVATMYVSLGSCNGGGVQLWNGGWGNRIDATWSLTCAVNHYDYTNYSHFLKRTSSFNTVQLGWASNRANSLKYVN